MSDKISVIVPVKTATEEFTKHIRSLLAIDYPNFDIIIVDDGMEKYPQLLEQHKQKIKVIKSQCAGPSFARNLAVKESEGEYVAFTDSDCLVGPNWLRELLKGFEAFPQAAACGGAQGLPDDATAFEKKVYTFMKKAGLFSEYVRDSSGRDIIKVRHNASCNVMYKRDIFLKAGGFQQGLWPGEDVELDYRLINKGCVLVYNPKAIVYHYRAKNIRSFCSMMYRYGLVQALLFKKYGFFRKIQVVPLASLSLLALLCALFLMNKLVAAGLSLFLAAALFLYFFDPSVSLLALIGAACWQGGFLIGLMKQSKSKY